MSDDEFTRLCDELFALRADLLKQVEDYHNMNSAKHWGKDA